MFFVLILVISYFMICMLWSLHSNILTAAGYQFDYVFDWTILKYPQIGGTSSRGRVSPVKLFFSIFIFSCGKHFLHCVHICCSSFISSFCQTPSGGAGLGAGPSAERQGRTSGIHRQTKSDFKIVTRPFSGITGTMLFRYFSLPEFSHLFSLES